MAQKEERYVFSRPKMGSPFNITVHTTDSNGLAAAINKCYARIDTLNQIFSDYSVTSELSLLCKNAQIGVFIPFLLIFYTILKKSAPSLSTKRRRI
ncbi:MAG: FAD:protein FMN transferase [Saprospiraceae bacterium]|nr:FAD:protein FMN transferase [Saprospiraceae bacterium]